MLDRIELALELPHLRRRPEISANAATEVEKGKQSTTGAGQLPKLLSGRHQHHLGRLLRQRRLYQRQLHFGELLVLQFHAECWRC
jgi:hypothetical protein